MLQRRPSGVGCARSSATSPTRPPSPRRRRPGRGRPPGRQGRRHRAVARVPARPTSTARACPGRLPGRRRRRGWSTSPPRPSPTAGRPSSARVPDVPIPDRARGDTRGPRRWPSCWRWPRTPPRWPSSRSVRTSSGAGRHPAGRPDRRARQRRPAAAGRPRCGPDRHRPTSTTPPRPSSPPSTPAAGGPRRGARRQQRRTPAGRRAHRTDLPGRRRPRPAPEGAPSLAWLAGAAVDAMWAGTARRSDAPDHPVPRRAALDSPLVRPAPHPKRPELAARSVTGPRIHPTGCVVQQHSGSTGVEMTRPPKVARTRKPERGGQLDPAR